MPRNDPSSTKLVKYDRWTTLAPSQRISASSRNNISALPRISRSTTARPPSSPVAPSNSSFSIVVSTEPAPHRFWHHPGTRWHDHVKGSVQSGGRPITVACHGSGMLHSAREPGYFVLAIGLWRSLVARLVRDEEAAGSNPVSPTHVISQEINSRITTGSESHFGFVCSTTRAPSPSELVAKRRSQPFRRELGPSRSAQPGGHELGDLHGVQGRTLAQVVVADEQRQPTVSVDAGVAA